MNRLSTTALAAFAFALSAASVDAAPKKKTPEKLPTPAPLALSTIESNAGLRLRHIEGNPHVLSAKFLHVCSENQKSQLVVPLGITYDLKTAAQHKVEPAARARVVALIEKRSDELLKEFTTNRASLTLLQSSRGTQIFTQRLLDFAHGVATGANMSVQLFVKGNIVAAKGCGTIQTGSQYEEAASEFMQKMRRSSTREAQFNQI